MLTGLLTSVVLVGASLAMPATGAHAQTLTPYSAGVTQTVSDSMVWANFGVAAPAVTPGDYASSAEILVKGGPTGTDSVAIGWTVNLSLNGDSNPHLFVYWTKAGVGQCYNAGCPGYTAYPGATFTAGQALTAGTAQRFRLLHDGGAWWFWAGNTAGTGEYFGYINDSNWGTAWPTFSTVQAFGQVTVAAAAPTTRMGNGTCADNPSALTIGSLAYNTATVNPTAFATDSNKYSVTMLSARTMRYGGDGSCP
ncbi:neprosin family prolyl endopeptidase [Actinoplanes sp. N902-109]|uniref:neprosin family prolyl endopeptidase n=1 Tax=Actinoplanes sp. (strain N902-109) TaxID=649831 RepID=UPI00032943C3|nr:neprosin family prolyl endopeptidase [Actinoplanes sp. N902-109]AGL18152.1 hypothetical protein L083_4642 [Actinoplanes sp. N902-109]